MDRLVRPQLPSNVFHNVNHPANNHASNSTNSYRLQPSQCVNKLEDHVDVEVDIHNVCKECVVSAKGIDWLRTSCKTERTLFRYLVIYIFIIFLSVSPFFTTNNPSRSFKHEMTNSRYTYLFHMSSHSSSFANFHPSLPNYMYQECLLISIFVFFCFILKLKIAHTKISKY